MQRIAHLSDLHVLATSTSTWSIWNELARRRARLYAVVMPIDVACHRPIGRAAGELSERTADAIEIRVRDLSAWGRPIVLALHHPPLPHAWRAWQWVDGLRGHRRLVDILERFDDTYVLHGHLHYAVEKSVGREERPRIFGATATVDDGKNEPRVRVYEASAGLAWTSEVKRSAA